MPKLPRIQAARAVAANLVVLSHCFLIQGKYVPGGWLPEFLHYGNSGVDIFFALSGFIIVVSGAAMRPVEFLWRRAGRIYPTYWLVSIVWFALIVALPSFVNARLPSYESLWRSFLLIPDYRTPLLDVGWTLTYEVYFYAVFALILAIRLPIHLGLVAWAAALVALRLLAGDAVASSPIASAYAGPLVAEFMMGALAGIAYRYGISAGANAAGAIGIAALAASIFLVGPMIDLVERPDLNLLRTLFFGVPAALVLHWLGAREHQVKAQLPRWLILLGDASYSTYLTHFLFLAVLSRVLHAAGVSGVWGSLVLTALGVVGANLTGVVLFLTFERPAMRALHRLRVSFYAKKAAVTGC
jgi:exopolysaccharide production protein ExoZ